MGEGGIVLPTGYGYSCLSCLDGLKGCYYIWGDGYMVGINCFCSFAFHCLYLLEIKSILPICCSSAG